MSHSKTEFSRERSGPRVRASKAQALRSGISAAALIAGLGVSGLAQAEDILGYRSSFMQAPPAAAGTDAVKTFWWGQVDVYSTVGRDGPTLDYTNRGTIGAASSLGTAVTVSSTGGRGGNGNSGVLGSLDPSNGGKGGNATFTQAGTIVAGSLPGLPLIWVISQGGAGGQYGGSSYGADGAAAGQAKFVHTSGKISAKAPQSTGTALVLVQAQGGAGADGLGKTTVTEGTSYSYLAARAGAGGAAGAASASINNEIAAEGSNLAALRVSSAGGDSGRGGIERTSDRSRARGGKGGSASIDIGKDGKISTVGDHATAIIAEARGGNGRKADEANDIRSSDGGGFTDSLANPAVRIVNDGSVSTKGSQAVAILAQAIGGNGGDGASTGSSGAATRGGDGGAGGVVMVEQRGSISTTFANSYGIVAQSIGGSGGRGGNGGVWGADGGRAGNGSSVQVSNTGTIETEAEGSTAIVAQSIGGGKALDAFNAALPTPSRTGGTDTSGAGGAGGSGGFLFFGSGGEGGGGGNGGTVEVRNGGSILTMQSLAYGIQAQSIGGGGGDGGVARSFGVFGGVALGGGGGGGGDGGTVRVNGAVTMPDGAPKPSISTRGDDSIAIFAQSVGGSGGIGGTATVNTAGIVGSVAVAIGGDGGNGGQGGKVEVDNTSIVSTKGANAIGIFAQSIGGGGGRAGDTSAYALAIAPQGWPAVSVATSIGGSGGGGGSGDSVNVTNHAAITTTGASAFGIQAQSVGGGGGAAGAAVSTSNTISLTGNVSVPVAVGGTGGGGGNGGTVTVTNKSQITTGGQFAFGITAASVGGGGGSGGAVQTSSLVGVSWEGALGSSLNDSINSIIGFLPTAKSIAAEIGVGGKGRSGGAGQQVTVNNEGGIHTTATNATAIFAQSVGGGGGTAGGFLGSGSGTVKVDVNVGGRGGDGGAGGNVTVKNLPGASIVTDEAGSHGIYAQSVGGGGGVGGGFTGKQKSYADISMKSAFELVKELLDAKELYADHTKPTTEEAKFAAKIAEWKKSATGDKTKDVAIVESFKSGAKLLKTILDGDKSIADKLARSAFIVGLAAAKVKYNEEIKVWKDGLKDKTFASLPSLGVDVNIGGKGGVGGAGGNVTEENAGRIVTKGETSFGMFAQSVGGGGGAGGAAYAAGENQINVKVTIGGGGNDAGAGGTVKATNSGSIATGGALAYGILAQSIGGGGGIGGVSASGDTLSISGNVIVGGSSGKSSNGGLVEVNNSGSVKTAGAEAHAIVAQSIGGGGGVYYVHQADPKKRAEFYAPPTEDEKEALKDLTEVLKRLGIEPISAGDATYNKDATVLPKPALNLSIGGDGGAGGRGETVKVSHSGSILTDGLASFGIFAQSLGGGGGLGGSAGGTGFAQIGYGLGGSGGSAGNGGDVTVTFGDKATIETKGTNSIAVFAQSIGGGGGYGGTGQDHLNMLQVGTAPYTPIRDGGSSGDGGTITVDMDTMAPGASMGIKTSGAGAHGIYAQSLGGGGGLVLNPKNGALVTDTTAIAGRSRASGSGGKIVIDTRGTIETTGANAYGIFAQSGQQKANAALDSSKAGKDIKITHSGTIAGGSDKGAAIRVDGGAKNTVTIAAGSTIGALSKIAIQGTFGQDTVENYGTIIGNVDLAEGGSREANAFNNRAGATYRSLSGQGDIRIGTGRLFENAGIFDVGGPGAIASTKLIGTFSQTGFGTLLVDFANPADNGGRANDLLHVEGSAAVGGRIDPRASWLIPGTYTVVTSTDGITDRPGLTGPQSGGVAISWAMGGGDKAISLTPTADFVNVKGATLSGDQQRVARYLQDGWNLSAAGLGATFPRFLSVTSPSAYSAALDEVDPETSQYATNGAITGARTALRSAMSCPAFTGSGTLLLEGECVWGRIGGGRTHMSGSADENGYRQNDLWYRIGGQKEFAPNWFVGGAASYTRSELKDPDGVTGTDTDSYDVSVSLKHQVGNWLFAASGTIGKSEVEHLRSISFGQTSARTRADSQIASAGARFRAAYEFGFSNWYVRPYLDLDVVHMRTSQYRETGTFGLDLNVFGNNKTLLAVNPNIEIGGRFDLGSGYWLRPYGSIGVSLLSSDQLVTRSSIVGAPIQLGAFETTSRIPDKLLDLGLGLQLSSGRGFELTGEYQAQTGKDFISHTGSAKLSWRF